MKRSLLRFVLLIAAAMSWQTASAANNILVFGDSLSAGYGIAREAAWATLLQHALQKNHPSFQVVNASISGETSSGGVRRIGQALQQYQPAVVIIELGANDGLRGTPLAETEKNLDAIIRQAIQAKAKVLLLGMQLPPNYGAAYTKKFKAIYPKLTQRHNVALLPFMLEGISPEQFLPDNMHPNTDAQARILHNVLTHLRPLLH